ncbi:hypothetical protein GBAR_LOCUS11643, partial [Geodia barretti]
MSYDFIGNRYVCATTSQRTRAARLECGLVTATTVDWISFFQSSLFPDTITPFLSINLLSLQGGILQVRRE